MSISNFCSKEIVTIDINSSIQEAASLMKENNIGDVLVTQHEKILGILTDRDIAIRLVADEVDFAKVKVGDVMTEHLLTLQYDLSLTKAIEALSSKGVRRAPIVDESGKPIGIITADDLLILLIGKMKKLAEIIEKQCEH
jgi:CBS domain-containing protein